MGHAAHRATIRLKGRYCNRNGRAARGNVQAHSQRILCVPKTLSVLIGGGNHLTSAHNDRAVMFCPERLGLAIKSKSRLEAENAALRHQDSLPLLPLRPHAGGRTPWPHRCSANGRYIPPSCARPVRAQSAWSDFAFYGVCLLTSALSPTRRLKRMLTSCFQKIMGQHLIVHGSCQDHAPNAESDEHHRLLTRCTALQICL